MLSSGVFGFESTGAFDNLSGGTFDVQVDTTIAQSTGSGGSFTNEAGATLKKSSGTGATTFLGLALTNSGTVDVQSGALYFDGGGTGSGTFQTHTSTGIYFSGGRLYTLEYGATLSGTGYFGCVDDFSALTVNTDLSVENFVLSADHSSGLAGTGIVTVTHDLNWQSGDIWSHVVVAQGATFELAGTVEKILDAGPIDNAGAATYSGTNLTLKSTLNNSGSFDDPADNEIEGSGTFNNLAGGMFAKTGGTGWTSISQVGFNNAGTVDVNAGGLSLDGASTHTGVFYATRRHASHLRVRSHAERRRRLDGPGLYEVVGQDSSLWLNADISVQNFLLDAQTLGGTAGLGVTGDFNWISGALTGTATVASGATLDMGPDSPPRWAANCHRRTGQRRNSDVHCGESRARWWWRDQEHRRLRRAV